MDSAALAEPAPVPKPSLDFTPGEAPAYVCHPPDRARPGSPRYQVAAAKARLAPPAPPTEPPATRKGEKNGRWITIPIKRTDDEER